MSHDENPTESRQPTIELVLAAQKGDAAALETLFSRYLPHVTQIVALRMGRRLGQMIEVEDVVQEVFIEVFRKDDVYRQADAEGFIRLFGLPTKVAAMRDRAVTESNAEVSG